MDKPKAADLNKLAQKGPAAAAEAAAMAAHTAALKLPLELCLDDEAMARREPEAEAPDPQRQGWLYRVAALPFRLYRGWLGPGRVDSVPAFHDAVECRVWRPHRIKL